MRKSRGGSGVVVVTWWELEPAAYGEGLKKLHHIKARIAMPRIILERGLAAITGDLRVDCFEDLCFHQFSPSVRAPLLKPSSAPAVGATGRRTNSHALARTICINEVRGPTFYCAHQVNSCIYAPLRMANIQRFKIELGQCSSARCHEKPAAAAATAP